MSCGCKSKQTYTKCGEPIMPNPVIKHIYDNCTNAPLYPITSTDAVIDADNKNLTTILAELEECKDNLIAQVQEMIDGAKEDFEDIFNYKLQAQYNDLKALIDAVNIRITDLHSGGSGSGGSVDPTIYTRLSAVESDLANAKQRLAALEGKNYDNLINDLHASIALLQTQIDNLKRIDHFLPTEVIPGNGLIGNWTTKTVELSLAPNLVHVVNNIPTNAPAGLYLAQTGMVTFYRGDLLNLGAQWNVSDVTALVNYILGNNLATAEQVQQAVDAAYAAIEENPEVPEDVVQEAKELKDIVYQYSKIPHKDEPLVPYNEDNTQHEEGGTYEEGGTTNLWSNINGVNNINGEVDDSEAELSEGEAGAEPADDTSGSLITYAELYRMKCDVNKDGNVNTSDIAALINIILGLAPKPQAETVASGEVLVKVYSDGSQELVAPHPGLVYIDIDHHRLLAFYNGKWNRLYADLIDQAVGA